MVLLLALSFQPFLECWLSGQTSVFGFAAFALAIRLERFSQPFRSGVCLALALYKPTLLVIVVPLLCVARNWRILLGFTAGAALFAGISLLTFGLGGCQAYGSLLRGFSQLMSLSIVRFPNWKYIDLNNFFNTLFGGQTTAGRVLLAASITAISARLAVGWWGYKRSDPDQKALLWASALTATLVLNVYVGIYDAVLAVIGVFLTTDALCHRTGHLGKVLTPAYKCLLALLFVIPWFSQHMARFAGFQPFTLVLIVLTVFQLRQAGFALPTVGSVKIGNLL
jgi:hypothetical protein